MRYLSVCSGIEAASAAWEPLGWRPLAFAEIDPFARAVLAHRFPSIPNLGDMSTISPHDFAHPVDLLVGGTPCQSFSVAGRRRGLADERGNLALVFARLVDALRPRWVVWENVPGALSSGKGRDFGAILGALVELGYGLAWRVLDAQFIGVPQRRRRVFVVGHSGGAAGRAAAVLFDPQGLRRDPPPRPPTWSDVARCLTTRAGGDRFDPESNYVVAPGPFAFDTQTSEVSASAITPTLCAKQRKDKPGNSSGCHLAVAFDPRNITSAANRSNPKPGDPSPTLATKEPPMVAFDCKASDPSASVGEVAPTLKAMSFAGSHANGGGQLAIAFDYRSTDAPGGEVARTLRKIDSAAVATPYGVRRLTPRECERLQGFPDDWTLVPYASGRRRNPRPASDSPRYAAIGNSMAVPVMAWIGRRIARVDQLLEQRGAAA